MDSKVYENPSAFYPERYLPKPEGLGEPFTGSIFGFGRRYECLFDISRFTPIFSRSSGFAQADISQRLVFGLSSRRFLPHST